MSALNGSWGCCALSLQCLMAAVSPHRTTELILYILSQAVPSKLHNLSSICTVWFGCKILIQLGRNASRTWCSLEVILFLRIHSQGTFCIDFRLVASVSAWETETFSFL